MGNVVAHPPDQESLFAQLRQSANDIDWTKVRAILQKHGSHAAQWKDTQNDGQYPLHYACWHNGPLNVIQTILTLWPNAVKERDKYGNLPLHYACENHQCLVVIQVLLAKWPDAVKEKDDNGNLPLHYASRYNQTFEVIKLLVDEYPAAVKEKDNNGYLPLHYACRNNQTLEVIQWLVKQWPDTVKEKDKVLQLPLHLASGNNQSLEVIQWLVKQWPQTIRERNWYEKTPLDFAQNPWFGKEANQATVSWLEKALKGDTTFPLAAESNDAVLETMAHLEGAKSSRLESLRAEVAELREAVQRQERVTTWVEALRIDLASLGESLHAVARQSDFLTENGLPHPDYEPVIASLANSEWKEGGQNKKTELLPNASYTKKVPPFRREEPGEERTSNAKMKQRREGGSYVSRQQNETSSHVNEETKEYDDNDLYLKG